MIIAVDFDGTCVDHKFPELGEDVPHAVDVLKELIEEGHKIILYTMRSGKYLESAIQWFKIRDIKLSGIQYENHQSEWTSSNKCYANLYIDDAALGAPLTYKEGPIPMIDWIKVRSILLGDSPPVIINN